MPFPPGVDIIARTFSAFGSGAATRPVQQKLREIQVSITDYGGKAGLSFDNTAAFNRALAALGSNGGVITFPIGDWRGNFLVNQDNILIQGHGGVGELNQTCLRPFTTGANTATVQFSNGTRINRKCAIRDLVISTDDGSGNMSDMGLYLAGGTDIFSAFRFELMGATHALHVQPGGGFPVTVAFFSHFQIRCDGAASTSRAIYLTRFADPNYLTAVYFEQGHINGPRAGAAVELDGSSVSISAVFDNVYMDIKPGFGVKLTGNATLVGWNSSLDPGGTGVVVVTTSQTPAAKDPSAFIKGEMGVSGQQIQWGDSSTTTFPADSGPLLHFPTISNPFIWGQLFFGKSTNVYDTSKYIDQQTDSGPLRVNGMSFKTRAGFASGTEATTVSGLPAANGISAGAGARAFVTDSTQTLAAGLGTSVVGGGANAVPVYSDGSTWLIG